jgi:hypothetical protein
MKAYERFIQTKSDVHEALSRLSGEAMRVLHHPRFPLTVGVKVPRPLNADDYSFPKAATWMELRDAGFLDSSFATTELGVRASSMVRS